MVSTAKYVALLLFCVFLCSDALQIKPTVVSTSFEVGDEELCLYSTGRDFFEGVMMSYKVIHGGVDFDVVVRNPEEDVIYASFAGEHGEEDRIYFTTHSKLEYAYCIDNRGYSKGRKVVQLEIGLTSLKRWKQRIDPLKRLMVHTEGSFLATSEDQVILRVREMNMREQVEKLFSLVALRGVTNIVIVACVGVINYFVLKRALR